MGLSLEQRQAMHEERYRLVESGDAVGAAKIQRALDADEPLVETEPEPEVVVPDEPTKNASAKKWREFALAASDIDEDIIGDASRKDIIGMLKANGIIE